MSWDAPALRTGIRWKIRLKRHGMRIRRRMRIRHKTYGISRNTISCKTYGMKTQESDAKHKHME